MALIHLTRKDLDKLKKHTKHTNRWELRCFPDGQIDIICNQCGGLALIELYPPTETNHLAVSNLLRQESPLTTKFHIPGFGKED